MKRSNLTILTLSMVLGLALVLPTAAFADSLVSAEFKSLDAQISNAYASGKLTASEKRAIRNMKAHTDDLIRIARSDGRVNPGERSNIRREMTATLETFNAYRDNGAVRYATIPAPAPVVKVVPARVRVVKRAQPRGRLVVVLR